MKTHKKIISGLLSVALIAGIGIGSVSAAPAKEFKDVPKSHWAHGDIQALTQLDVLAGYSNGTFKPQENVTRAQAAKIISLAAGIEPVKTTKSSYKDVGANHWALPYIEALTKEGVIHGKGNGTFGPQDMLTRAQMSKILGESFGYTKKSNNSFNDVKSNHWAYNYIVALRDNNISVGYPQDNTYRPYGNVTRAQMAAFANRSLKWEAEQVKAPAPRPSNPAPAPTPAPKPEPKPDPTPAPPAIDPNDPNRPIDESIGTNPDPIEFPDVAKQDKYPESFTWMMTDLEQGYPDIFFNPAEVPTHEVHDLMRRVLATDANKYGVTGWTAYAEGHISVKYGN